MKLKLKQIFRKLGLIKYIFYLFFISKIILKILIQKSFNSLIKFSFEIKIKFSHLLNLFISNLISNMLI